MECTRNATTVSTGRKSTRDQPETSIRTPRCHTIDAPMTRSRRITVQERRTRLGVRHRLAPTHRATDVVEAARSVVCLHATDPATVFLSARARVDGMTCADLERALY